ncbi:MAG: DUF2889 domain-containing protein [Pseudomonadota bacterium]
MISFSRTMIVGGEFLSEALLRLHGILEDEIYGMEVTLDVSIPDGVITAIQGRMKRYTNPVCPKAPEVLQQAVGISFRKPGWVSNVNREIGRKGCTHLAEILIECGRCLDPARMTLDLQQKFNADPSASPVQAARSWVESHPEIQGSCLARK